MSGNIIFGMGGFRPNSKTRIKQEKLGQEKVREKGVGGQFLVGGGLLAWQETSQPVEFMRSANFMAETFLQSSVLAAVGWSE